MTRFLVVAKAALCLTGIALLASLSLVAWRVADLAKTLNANVVTTSAKVNLNLDEAHRLILEAGLTAMEARKASVEEEQYLRTWNAGVTKTMANTNALLVSMKATSDGIAVSQAALAQHSEAALASARTSIDGLQPAEAQLADELQALTKATRDVDALASNPDMPKTLANVEQTTAAAAAFSADSEHLMHQLAYPPKKKRSPWGYIGSGVRMLSWFVKLSF